MVSQSGPGLQATQDERDSGIWPDQPTNQRSSLILVVPEILGILEVKDKTQTIFLGHIILIWSIIFVLKTNTCTYKTLRP